MSEPGNVGPLSDDETWDRIEASLRGIGVDPDDIVARAAAALDWYRANPEPEPEPGDVLLLLEDDADTL